MVANVIGRDHGVCSERMLYFKIPLNVLRVLEVAADIIQVRNRKGAFRVETTAERRRSSSVAGQVTATCIVRGKRTIALSHQVHAAAWKCSGCRGRQVKRHASGRHIEQVYLREVRIEQAQET